MSLIAPRTPSGTLELLPPEQMAFQHLLDTIRRGYERYGFLPIETPVFERREVLLTKSGGETEKQVYFVQSTGSLAQQEAPELALRFDLTVPTARYVAEHERELAFPFRRYQIQRVYRGERAQKGRFREFYQADIDIIGKDKLSPLYDAEIPAIIYDIFQQLAIGDFVIHISNRKVLLGLLNAAGVATSAQQAALIALDKLDKIGATAVAEQLQAAGLPQATISQMLALAAHVGDAASTLALLAAQNITDPTFAAGCAELASVVETLTHLGVPASHWRLNLGIVRGLDYYTGTIYETTLTAAPQLGSICSGGRYDNLASHYTRAQLPGVGISIGATRLFDYLRSSGWAGMAQNHLQILILTQAETLRGPALQLAAACRQAGYNCELYLEPAKLDKQLRYASKIGVPVCLILAETEQAQGQLIVKAMHANTQQTIASAALLPALAALLPAARR